ncbi:MAG: hypothetical protein E7554_04575 [Ruminococcaceae bacterium]|nr:hypothetical protein [Oscillospiraceae bacterium]
MKEHAIANLCAEIFGKTPDSIQRCTIGQGNYVSVVETEVGEYVFRLSEEAGAYRETIHWLSRLAEVQIPVPAIIAHGQYESCEYLVLSYIEGEDLGQVYQCLTDSEKRTIAAQVARIQRLASKLEPEGIADDWTWKAFVDEMLDRAESRIRANGYFDTERVDRLRRAAEQLADRFAAVQPTVYLDDISTKNLLIHNGQVSGVIDVDWIGVGDVLTFAALTNMALLNMELDTDYVSCLLEELRADEGDSERFLFYTLMFCVDFMGERGMQFLDKRIEVSNEIVGRLYRIYDDLWREWCESHQ